jgi:hypothetical protein
LASNTIAALANALSAMNLRTGVPLLAPPKPCGRTNHAEDARDALCRLVNETGDFIFEVEAASWARLVLGALCFDPGQGFADLLLELRLPFLLLLCDLGLIVADCCWSRIVRLDLSSAIGEFGVSGLTAVNTSWRAWLVSRTSRLRSEFSSLASSAARAADNCAAVSRGS